jgi:hypothetical protein
MKISKHVLYKGPLFLKRLEMDFLIEGFEEVDF